MPLCRHYVLGNGKFRCVVTYKRGFKNPHITAYICNEGGIEDTRIDVLRDNDLPFPGNPDIIRSVETLCPGKHIKINMELAGGKILPWELWVTEDDYLLFFKSPTGRGYYLKFDREKRAFRQAFPLFFGNVAGKIPPPKTQSEIFMQDKELADITNSLAPVFSAAMNNNGRFPAGIHNAYEGVCISDAIMSAAGWACADYRGIEKLLSYLFENVSPAKEALEEYGMMIWGIYQFWRHSGNDLLPAKFAVLLKEFARKPLENLSGGLLISDVEGYWKRTFLGKGFSFSQNIWAIIGIDCCLEMAEKLGWRDDFTDLREKRELIFKNLFHSGKFVKSGFFVQRLLADEHPQEESEIPRLISMAKHPYNNELARPFDLQPSKGTLNPDVQVCCAWLWGLTPPESPECIATSNEMWKLWNQEWHFGGMSRCNISGDCDRETAGPWFSASFMAARALLLQNDYLRVSQIVEWGKKEFNGSGWSERISRSHNTDDPNRYFHEILSRSAGEWLMMIYREGAGLHPTPDGLKISPHLPRKFQGLEIKNYRFRNYEYNIKYSGAGCEIRKITLNGREVPSNLIPCESGNLEVAMKN